MFKCQHCGEVVENDPPAWTDYGSVYNRRRRIPGNGGRVGLMQRDPAGREKE